MRACAILEFVLLRQADCLSDPILLAILSCVPNANSYELLSSNGHVEIQGSERQQVGCGREDKNHSGSAKFEGKDGQRSGDKVSQSEILLKEKVKEALVGMGEALYLVNLRLS